MPVSAPAGDKKVLRASVLHYDPEPSSNDVQDAAEPFPEGTARVVMLRRLARATQAPTAPWVDLDLALHAAVVRDLSGVPRAGSLGRHSCPTALVFCARRQQLFLTVPSVGIAVLWVSRQLVVCK